MNQYFLPSNRFCRAATLVVSLSLGVLRAENDDSIHFPLLTSCFEDAERIAEVGSTDSIKVRYASVASSRGSCYSVALNKNGRTLTGFLVGATLPAIQQFDAEARSHIPEAPRPVAPPPAAPSTAAANAAPPPPERRGPESLSGLHGWDLNGHMVELNALSASNVIVYFWSPADKRSAKRAESMDYIYGTYHSRRLDIVGVASAPNIDIVRQECGQNEVVWTQLVDRGELAKRFNVDPKYPFLIVDRSRKVIATAATPKELEVEIRRLGLK